ncbi:MAG TPA: HPr family phosphocarrier protein [Myxococcota bacterium]|jgi:phosphotransferase system HPr (HPr) family protein
MSEISRQVMIVNDLGLHARAASKLVQLASKFPVEIKIGHEDMTVNAKSIMGVLMLAAAKGTDLTLTVVGDDDKAQAAVDAVVDLIQQRFGEDR